MYGAYICTYIQLIFIFRQTHMLQIKGLRAFDEPFLNDQRVSSKTVRGLFGHAL